MIQFGDMENNEGGVCNGKGNDPFIGRSKVRILLCDNDSKSCGEVCGLLCKCSYQVTSVRSAGQVVDALNAEGSNIDIILSEIDLPTRKGFKMLKYIMGDKELQRIPVIMMSTQDEVSLVVKCLRLGAADYLVKPLRTNELLNLWIHMWRRRQMLGLAEKNIINYDVDLIASDHSDANTNSTTLFSDDTDDRSRKSCNPELSLAIQPEVESNKATSEPMPGDSLDCQPHVPRIYDRRTDQSASFLQKSGLKIGECSAFFTYVKSSAIKNNSQALVNVEINDQPSRPEEKSEKLKERVGNGNVQQHVSNGNLLQHVNNGNLQHVSNDNLRYEKESEKLNEHVGNGNSNLRHENGEAWENNSLGEDFPSSTSVPESTSIERSGTPPASLEFMSNKSNDEGLSHVQMNFRNGKHIDASGLAAHATYPYYMSGVLNQAMLPSSAHIYHKDVNDPGTSVILPHYGHIQHCPSRVPGMGPFTYYPFGVCVPQDQLPSNHQMPPHTNSSSEVCRREAALIKFRQKRKERCFDKKIRYVNRKKLAERRPRVRGQFVRKVNGVMVDLNGDPSRDLDEEDEDDDDPTSRDSSPKDDTS